jgi:hypothetical protein
MVSGLAKGYVNKARPTEPVISNHTELKGYPGHTRCPRGGLIQFRISNCLPVENLTGLLLFFLALVVEVKTCCLFLSFQYERAGVFFKYVRYLIVLMKK